MRGIDLGELWRERRWALLLSLLMRLPRNSLAKETLSQDDEFMEQVLDAADGSESAQIIRLSEYTPEVEALYGVIDRLGDVVKGLVGLGGGKRHPNIPPMRRPQTALDRVMLNRRREEHRSLVARVLPGRAG